MVSLFSLGLKSIYGVVLLACKTNGFILINLRVRCDRNKVEWEINHL